MNVVAVRETVAGEKRVPVTPQTAGRLVRLGASVAVEAGLGAALHVPDSAYEAAGATVGRREELLAGADLLLTVQPPSLGVVGSLRPGAVTPGFGDAQLTHGLRRPRA